MLAADFADKRGCPRCGNPLRRLGTWTNEEGEWLFHPKPISCYRPRDERPIYSQPERWTPVESPVVKTDERTGAVRETLETKWHYLAEYECMGPLHDPEYNTLGFDYPCGVVQDLDAVTYRGPHIPELMDAPGALKPVPRLEMP